ncbi:membrane transport protein XK isoform X3 [Vanacampus margaritifer]
MRLPSSIFLSVSLFTAETTAALYLSSTYKSAGDQVWQTLTLLFSLVPSMLVQLALIFFYRDLGRDRPFILLLHMLQFGPIVRCLEAFWTYGSVGRVEEPYVSITRKKQMPRRGEPEEVERQVGQAEGKLVTHRAAFARTAVMQAFLGSAPQLTLQLYICVLQRGVSVGRGTLMVISLLSIVYGALRCNILAIKIKYDEYHVSMSPSAYLCIFMWRSCEIASRVVVLVLFSSVLKIWVVPVVVLNFLAFFFYPWILFWRSHSPFPQNIEKTLTRVGTAVVLCMLTFLYAGINVFCWSAVQDRLLRVHVGAAAGTGAAGGLRRLHFLHAALLPVLSPVSATLHLQHHEPELTGLLLPPLSAVRLRRVDQRTSQGARASKRGRHAG